MKKILPFLKSFALIFVTYFVFSLLLNQLFQSNESIGEEAMKSLLFVVFFHIFGNWVNKAKKEKQEDQDQST